MNRTAEARSHARGLAIDIGVERAHSARMIDALDGERTNFTIDREVAWRIRQLQPLAPIALAPARLFVCSATRHLAASGLYQFLDLGAGLPQIRSLHETLQPTGAETRVVYVDHDPIVIAYLEALLCTEPLGGLGVLHADVTEPEHLLSVIAEQGVVDLTRPLVVVMAALLTICRPMPNPPGYPKRSPRTWRPTAPSCSPSPPTISTTARRAPPRCAVTRGSRCVRIHNPRPRVCSRAGTCCHRG